MKKGYAIGFFIWLISYIGIVLGQPPNNNCSNATTLTVNAPCTNGTTVGSNFEPGELTSNCNGGPLENQSVWYQFTATNDSIFIGFEDGPDCNVNIEVFDGSQPCPDPGYIGCVDWGTGGGTLLLTGLTIGNTYYFKIESRNCGTNDFCVRVAEPKSNNDPCGAIPIAVNGGCVVDSNWYSTDDAGLGVPSCWSGTAQTTVWYSFVATNDSMIISTDFLQDYYNGIGYGGSPINAPQVAVYSSSNGTCTGVLSEIACSQLDGLYIPGGYLFLTGLTPGETYFIRLNGAAYSSPFIYPDVLGSYCIQVHEPCQSAIAGETASSASQIDNCGTAFNGSTNGSSHEGLQNTNAYEDLDCDGTTEVNWTVENDTWFYFCVDPLVGTQNWNFEVSVTSCASGCGIQWGVMQGTPNSLNPLYTTTNTANCNTDAVNPGETDIQTISIDPLNGCVYIVFDGYGGSICDYSISITCPGCGSCVLPVEVTQFTAKKKGNGIEVTWRILEEMGIQFYRIYKSEDDGETYFLLGEIPASGGGQYRILDWKPTTGANYYHLKAIETTGKEIDLMAYAVAFYRLEGLDVEYDPITHALWVSDEQNRTAVLSMWNLNGQLVLEQQLNLQAYRTQQITLPQLSSGIYFWKIGDQVGKLIISE